MSILFQTKKLSIALPNVWSSFCRQVWALSISAPVWRVPISIPFSLCLFLCALRYLWLREQQSKVGNQQRRSVLRKDTTYRPIRNPVLICRGQKSYRHAYTFSFLGGACALATAGCYMQLELSPISHIIPICIYKFFWWELGVLNGSNTFPVSTNFIIVNR